MNEQFDFCAFAWVGREGGYEGGWGWMRGGKGRNRKDNESKEMI